MPILPPFFQPAESDGLARIGRFTLYRQVTPLTVETPVLFPVANLLTGTTPRGGGIWKYVLRFLFQQHTPIMTQALQFLDFRLTASELQRWIHSPNLTVLDRYLAHYRTDHPELGIDAYRGVVFMDSGGYKFLANPRVDLTAFGIGPGSNAWRGILRIQRGLGGDFYTSLDYPLRPGLVDDEAQELIRRSSRNALRVYRELKQTRPSPPFYVPCHGRSQEELHHSVATFFRAAQAEGLLTGRLGVAVGSLVPLRTVQRIEAILSIFQGAQTGIPQELREQTPLHVFGISGSMIPLLVYLGVDSFDSSSYIQNARTLDYYLPQRYVRTRFLEMEGQELPCSCPHCVGRSLREMHQVLVGESREDLSKSEVYARLALHNLHWDQTLLQQTKAAVRQGALEEFLVQHAAHFPTVRPGVELLGRSNTSLSAQLSRRFFGPTGPSRPTDEPPLFGSGPIDLDHYEPGLPPWLRPLTTGVVSRPSSGVRRISLKYTPDSFAIPQDWCPTPQKDILLILPCSDFKPYRESHGHHAILSHLAQRLGSTGRIQKVTLSGLYGPVPEEFEDEPAVLGYDFRLIPSDEVQVQLCTSRLVDFLRRHGNRFLFCIGYVTSRAYRDAIKRAAPLFPNLVVLPANPVRQQMTELFRRENLDQLAQHIETEVLTRGTDIARQASS